MGFDSRHLHSPSPHKERGFLLSDADTPGVDQVPRYLICILPFGGWHGPGSIMYTFWLDVDMGTEEEFTPYPALSNFLYFLPYNAPHPAGSFLRLKGRPNQIILQEPTVKAIKRSFIIVLLLVLILMPFTLPVQKAFAAVSPCKTSSPSSVYSLTICITTPANGTTFTGYSTITATVSVTGTNPGIQYVTFYLNEVPILEDFSAPYTFIMPTNFFLDGTYTLSTDAMTRSQFLSGQASILLTLKTGTVTPPVNPLQFLPTSGRAAATGSPFILAVVGDGAGGESSEARVSNLIASWNPNLFFYLGDIYERGTPSEIYNWYGSSSFFGRFKSITDPTVGNHDYMTGSDWAYRYYWNNVPDYYSFNANGWHFISLDSNILHTQTSTTSPEYLWLQQDLTANTSKCTAVYYHHPYLSIGKEGGTPQLINIWQLMAQHHVTLILNGHDHEYQRWVPLDGNGNPSATGMTEIITGTGGHSITPFVTSDSRVAAKYSAGTATYGALRLVLNPTSANFSFITTGGTVIDSGTVTCKG